MAPPPNGSAPTAAQSRSKVARKGHPMRNGTLAILTLSVALSLTATESWTQFRGPTGQGVSDATGLPVTWKEKDDSKPAENIKWKTELPGQGWSSPVVAGNQIWMTTATDEGKSLRALCVALDSGK